MAQRGERVAGPRTEIIFQQTAQDTDGALLQFEQTVQPGSPATVQHVHPRQTERFVVLSGTMGTVVAGKQHILQEGEELTIQPGVPHAFWNAGDTPLRQLIELRPALQSETFFETIVGFETDGTLPASGPPNLLKLALILPTYDVYLANMPRWAQHILFGFLGEVGRLLGYRRWYPAYSPYGPATVRQVH